MTAKELVISIDKPYTTKLVIIDNDNFGEIVFKGCLGYLQRCINEHPNDERFFDKHYELDMSVCSYDTTDNMVVIEVQY